MRRTPALTVLAFTLTAVACRPIAFDFAGPHGADLITIDVETEAWYNADGTVFLPPGERGFPAPADYDGDGRTDVAFTAFTGTFRRADGTTLAQVEAPSLEPKDLSAVPADYDGDRKADPAVFRDSDGTFFILGQAPISLGTDRTGAYGSFNGTQEVPVVADYDGDRKADAAHWSPKTGIWTIRHSSTGAVTTVDLGKPLHLEFPVAADVDGDGKAEPGLFSQAGYRGASHGTIPLPAGVNFRLPAVADYDGDHKDDLAYVDDTATVRSLNTPLVHTYDDHFDYYRAPIASNHAVVVMHISRFTLIARCNADPGTC